MWILTDSKLYTYSIMMENTTFHALLIIESKTGHERIWLKLYNILQKEDFLKFSNQKRNTLYFQTKFFYCI